MPRLGVVVNPTKPVVEQVRSLVAATEERLGWDPTLWYETTVEDPGVEMASQAAADGADVVLAVGGDGTVRAVAEGLRDSAATLAVCAQGTGNLLAHNLGLPVEDVPAAVELAFTGQGKPIDLIQVDYTQADGTTASRICAVMAGVGLDAQIMSKTDEGLKRKVGVLAYVHAGAVEVGRNRRMQVSYRVDGGSRKRARAQMVLIGNCGSIGYNVYVLPDAAIDDGQLDLLVAQPVTLAGWVVVGWRVLVDNWLFRKLRLTKRRRGDHFTTYLQGRRVELRFDQEEEIELDGDHFGAVTAATFTVLPSALPVQVPAL